MGRESPDLEVVFFFHVSCKSRVVLSVFCGVFTQALHLQRRSRRFSPRCFCFVTLRKFLSLFMPIAVIPVLQNGSEYYRTIRVPCQKKKKGHMEQTEFKLIMRVTVLKTI